MSHPCYTRDDLLYAAVLAAIVGAVIGAVAERILSNL